MADVLAGDGLSGFLTADSESSEDCQKGVEVSGLEWVVALPGPGGGQFAPGAIDRPPHLAEVFLGTMPTAPHRQPSPHPTTLVSCTHSQPTI